MRTMYRYEIPVDDRYHEIKLSDAGYPMAFGAKWEDETQPPIVEFWAEHDDSFVQRTAIYRIYGTGHPIGDGDHPSDQFIYVGTAPRWRGLVWHVYEYVGYDVQ